MSELLKIETQNNFYSTLHFMANRSHGRSQMLRDYLNFWKILIAPGDLHGIRTVRRLARQPGLLHWFVNSDIIQNRGWEFLQKTNKQKNYHGYNKSIYADCDLSLSDMF